MVNGAALARPFAADVMAMGWSFPDNRESALGTIVMPTPDDRITSQSSMFVRELVRLLGSDAVISDADGRRTYETDALTAYSALPLAVVLPRTTEDVSRTLSFCRQHGIKVFPRGAGTSLCGGALPAEDGIVLCLSRMTKVLEIDFDNRYARVEAGVTNLAVSQAVSHRGFFYAPDPSSQLACTIGGNIATNSGGAHCLKYGVTLNNVLGVTVVLIDGEIVELGGPHLDSAGYDLLGLMIGSEGQLGVVTEATVRILRATSGARPMMLGFSSAATAARCVAAIVASGILPVAIEYMDRTAISVCEDFASAGYPRDAEALLIVEVEGFETEIDVLLERISAIAAPFMPTTVSVSDGPEHSARIWLGRKSIAGAIGRISESYCMDGAIPLSRLAEVLEKITVICGNHGLRVANILHAGDGNLHPMILYDANNDDEADRAEQAGAEILTLCVEVGGCLSGEHGIGLEKRDLMRLQFSDADLALQMHIKAVYDPDWLLNPGKVFPLALPQVAGAEAKEALFEPLGVGA